MSNRVATSKVNGKRIKKLRMERKISQTELGKQLGVTKGAVYRWERGTLSPSTTLLVKMAELFGVDVGYLVSDTNETLPINTHKSTPIFSALSCGTGTYVDEEPEEIIKLPSVMIPDGIPTFANVAEGDSMEPRIHHGDTLVFQQTDYLPSGEVGSFSLNDQYYCKRLRKFQNGKCFLYSDNSEYPPIEIKPEDDFRVIGKLIAKVSKW